MADNMFLVTQCHESNPDSFILPAGYDLKTAVVSLPVIDMSRGRDEVRRAILDAGKELGFFQVSYNIHQIKSLLPLIASITSIDRCVDRTN